MSLSFKRNLNSNNDDNYFDNIHQTLEINKRLAEITSKFYLSANLFYQDEVEWLILNYFNFDDRMIHIYNKDVNHVEKIFLDLPENLYREIISNSAIIVEVAKQTSLGFSKWGENSIEEILNIYKNDNEISPQEAVDIYVERHNK